MTDAFTWQLLAAYLSGEGSADERAAVEAWIAAEPGRTALVAGLGDVWQRTAHARDEAPPVDVAAAHERLRARVAARHGSAESRPTLSLAASTPHRSNRAALAYAAGLAIALALVAIAIHTPRMPDREFTTARGERAAVRLADGTQVTLGAASRLRIPGVYAHDGARDVALEGEALFTVHHDPSHPFAVRVAHGMVHDVGTTFAVQAYPEDATAGIAVAEGQVSITRRGNGWGSVHGTPQAESLTQGDLAIVSDTSVAVIHGADVGALTSWAQGQLVFKDTPLRDVVAELGRWYAVDVRLADPRLAVLRLTASFDTESLPEALRVISLALNLRAERAGDTVTFHSASRGQPGAAPPLQSALRQETR
jgi:transmembrane sensor